MKTYIKYTITTTIFAIFALISFALIFVCHYYKDTTFIALSAFLFVAYTAISFYFGIKTKNDYEDFKKGDHYDL